MTDLEVKALERVIELSGDCLQAIDECTGCPLQSQCWTSFVTPAPMKKRDRVNMAADILVERHFLSDE